MAAEAATAAVVKGLRCTAASAEEYATAASGEAAWRAPSGGRSASVPDVRGP